MSSWETLRRTLLYHPSGVSTNRLSLEGEGQSEGEPSVRIQVTEFSKPPLEDSKVIVPTSTDSGERHRNGRVKVSTPSGSHLHSTRATALDKPCCQSQPARQSLRQSQE